jgi:hypothetical protein
MTEITCSWCHMDMSAAAWNAPDEPQPITHAMVHAFMQTFPGIEPRSMLDLEPQDYLGKDIYFSTTEWPIFALWAVQQGHWHIDLALKRIVAMWYETSGAIEPPHVRTCEELARDIYEYCDLDHGRMVSLEAVQDRMRHSMDHPSHERIVAAIEQLERDGMVWCLFSRAGELMGYRMKESAFEPRGPDEDDDTPF